MRKMFRTLALLLTGLLVVFVLVGCGSDEDVENEKMPVSFVSANPPGGCALAANASITLTFDGEPEDVRVSAGTVIVAGKTVTIVGPFFPVLALTITWADEIHVLNYTICGVDLNPPDVTVTGGTVEDGGKDVNPEAINSDTKIKITFAEEVTGNIALQTEAGDDLG